MKISYNAPAMIAHNALTRNDNRLTESLKRLSSGLKVVEAKDNPAGMAMGKRMKAQLKGLSVATQNSSDAVSAIEIADGALSEIHDILQRMNELAVQASTDSVGEHGRSAIEEEIIQLKSEITRIADTTDFNGEKLLNGNFDLRGYTTDNNLQVGFVSDQVTAGTYKIQTISGLVFDADNRLDPDPTNITFTPDPTAAAPDLQFPPQSSVTKVTGNTITITSASDPDFEMNLKVVVPAPPAVPAATSFNNVDVTVTGIGPMTMQIGSNEGEVLDIRIPTISLERMGIEDLTMVEREDAVAALDSVKEAISYVSAARSRLGAYQNRLEHCISNLDTISENMTAAYSRIMDADMAEEMTEYTTVQVISQASMSMLAQANERPAQVLQLLQ